MVQRERWTHLSELETQLMAQGMFAGGKGDEVYKAVMTLTKEVRARVFQHGFNPQRLLARLHQELDELRAAQKRLDKLDAMTV